MDNEAVSLRRDNTNASDMAGESAKPELDGITQIGFEIEEKRGK